jgi:dsRNA-specific ribonuclease|uniref:RNase III domain-containing protein n=1 Tax=viral metagenome TaxID=1070528 RepID=A0A6C0I545_9ZZZZ
MYRQQLQEATIVEGNHKELRGFLFNIIKQYAELSRKNIEKILSDANMVEFKKAFTAPSVNANYNYEFYEFLGDSTANNCIVWYFQRRFYPKAENVVTAKGTMMPVAIMSRLKQIGASTRTFSKFSNVLGFLPYISMNSIEYSSPAKILEDVFEAFIGCLVYHCDLIFGLHTGFTVAYPIIEKLFNMEEISLERENLYEAKSLVNEDITKFPKNTIKFEYQHIENKDKENKNEKYYSKAVMIELSGNRLILQTPQFHGPTKQDNEQRIAKHLLNMNEYKAIKNRYNIQ